MTKNCPSLTEREKQTLRLILQGHDAKSMAQALGLSVHTINDHLRGARRKLEVTSSKEAARQLREHERACPNSFVPKDLGRAEATPNHSASGAPKAGMRFAWKIGGSLVMSIVVAAITLAALTPPAVLESKPRTEATGETGNAAAETEAVSAARHWLELVDNAEWLASWEATGTSFRELNTVERWTRVSEKDRVPLGAALSREVVSEESVPAPPKGYQMVKFRTEFVNKPAATETLALAREDGVWKVVGCWIS
ncbi:DNA-binding CsgD family transcriptional regulator [Altererythrobacter atlanticus]|uniref:LuxR family regulatory protein n=1 Tax=Croceibacterium atlanticum TaxID=1267766 RepID=A0A0F7KVF7_9SPHN|nr:DUF4019 domain-containing protein [Croceibacterium atlanticum]AKH43161.1 LuxR family regulatory protein [Croceibacterium atlanticum]MBB5732134.1 DNA-binding CsgD family transcriptional regulator [Croceibacterium atlanticum]